MSSMDSEYKIIATLIKQTSFDQPFVFYEYNEQEALKRVSWCRANGYSVEMFSRRRIPWFPYMLPPPPPPTKLKARLKDWLGT